MWYIVQKLYGDGDGNNAFAISSTCVITVNDAGDLDYESATSHTLTILATDGSSADSETVAISVTDQAIDITATSFTIAENLANDGAVGTLYPPVTQQLMPDSQFPAEATTSIRRCC